MDYLKEIWFQIVEYAPKISLALGIIILSFILIRVFTRLLRRLLRKVGIDKLADNYVNRIDFLEKNNIRFVPSSFISEIIYYLFLLISLVVATDFLQMEAVSDLVKSAIDYIPSLITATALLIVGLFIADFVQDISLTALQSLNVPAAKFVAGIIFYFILLNVLMLALEQARINTDFITSNISIILAGIVLAFSIGYGFASKDVMSNHIGYFYNRSKIHLGDVVSIGGKEGMVVGLDNTTLTIRADKDARHIIIPLSKLNTEAIEIISRAVVEPVVTVKPQEE